MMDIKLWLIKVLGKAAEREAAQRPLAEMNLDLRLSDFLCEAES